MSAAAGETLFLAHRIPWPPDRGDKIRSHAWLKALAGAAPVHVGCFLDDPADDQWVGALESLALSVHAERRQSSRALALARALACGRPVSLTAFASRRLAAWVERTLAERPVARIVVFSGQMAQYIPAGFRGRVVLDLCDVDSAKFHAYAGTASAPMAALYRREARLLAEVERLAATRADATLLVSAPEAELFARRSGAANVRALGNGVDTGYFDPSAAFDPLDRRGAGPLILFTGQMDYPPNVEAVEDFARHALPALGVAYPDLRFAIVGRAPSARVRALAGGQVIVTGAVPDVRPWLAAADLVVAPLKLARGVQNKVLEAMAMARPVLATPAAATGIEAQAGSELLVAHSPSDQARAALQLLADPARGEALGRAARALVVEHYGWPARQAELLSVCGLAPRAAAAPQAAGAPQAIGAAA